MISRFDTSDFAIGSFPRPTSGVLLYSKSIYARHDYPAPGDASMTRGNRYVFSSPWRTASYSMSPLVGVSGTTLFGVMENARCPELGMEYERYSRKGPRGSADT